MYLLVLHCIEVPVCLFIHLLKDTLVASSVGWLFRFLCGHKFSNQLGEHLGTQLLGRMVRLFKCVIHGRFVFQSGCTILRCHQNKSSVHSTSSSAFGIVSFLDVGCSNRRVVVSRCCFNLYFPNGRWCVASFHMLFVICLSSLVKCMLDWIGFANLILRTLHWYSWDRLVF